MLCSCKSVISSKCYVNLFYSCKAVLYDQPVVRKINISHFKDSASHRKFSEGKEGQGYSTVSFQVKENIWKTNGIAFMSRVYFADKNRLTTTISNSGKRTLKWVQGNNSSQKYNNVL